MKYLLFALVLFVLTACDSSSDINAARAQYQAASANLSAAIAQQAAIDKATVQAKMAATEAVMATQGAQDAAVKQLQIEASATMSAIDIKAQQDDLLNRQALATRIANDYNLQATQEWQSAQATSTAIYLDIQSKTAKVKRAQATADFWSSFLPTLGGIVLVSLALLFCVLVWYAGKRAKADADKRDIENKKNEYRSRFYPARGGTYYLPDGEPYPVLVNVLNRIWELPSGEEHEEELIDIPEAEPSQSFVDKSDGQYQAGMLIRLSVQANGWESQNILGHTKANMSGSTWTKALDYIRDRAAVDAQPGDGTRLTNMTLKDVYYLIYASPTPEVEVKK